MTALAAPVDMPGVHALAERIYAALDREQALAEAASRTSGAEWWVEHFDTVASDQCDVVAAAGNLTADEANHVAAHDPATVLARVAALRQAVREQVGMAEWDHPGLRGNLGGAWAVAVATLVALATAAGVTE